MANVTVRLNRAKLHSMQTQFMARTIKMANDIATQARANAPVLTGNLQSSIRVEEGKNIIMVKAGGGWSWNVPYAKFQEYNNKTKAHYMLRAEKSVVSGDWAKKYYGGMA